MIRLAAFAAALALVPGAALAGPPMGGNSDIPVLIPVVGTQRGVPHPGHSVAVNVRDFSNEPIPGALVWFDFSGCVDIRLCDAVIAGAGTVVCANGWVTGTTDAAGHLEFTVVGGGTNHGGSPGNALPCVEIWADALQLGTARAWVVNPDGALPGGNGMGGTDFSLVFGDILIALGGGAYVARSDFSGDVALSGLDAALESGFILASLAGQGSASGCHDGVSQQPYCP